MFALRLRDAVQYFSRNRVHCAIRDCCFGMGLSWFRISTNLKLRYGWCCATRHHWNVKVRLRPCFNDSRQAVFIRLLCRWHFLQSGGAVKYKKSQFSATVVIGGLLSATLYADFPLFFPYYIYFRKWKMKTKLSRSTLTVVTDAL